MIYKHPEPITKNEAEDFFKNSDAAIICDTLVAIAFYESDWKWVQEKCLYFLEADNPDIRAVAATCLGHVARIHKQLDRDKVINALKKHIHEKNVGGSVEDALGDIHMSLE